MISSPQINPTEILWVKRKTSTYKTALHLFHQSSLPFLSFCLPYESPRVNVTKDVEVSHQKLFQFARWPLRVPRFDTLKQQQKMPVSICFARQKFSSTMCVSYLLKDLMVRDRIKVSRFRDRLNFYFSKQGSVPKPELHRFQIKETGPDHGLQNFEIHFQST